MNITIKIKTVYGVERIYPVCENAKLFLSLTGNKTFSLVDIEHIKALGYDVEVEQAKI